MAENKLYCIFNFIEVGGVNPPFKTFIESWTQTSVYVKRNPQFLTTMMHRNLNPTGAYPHVNHASFDGTDFEGFGKPTKAWIDVISVTQSAYVYFPGGYTEIGTTTGKPLAPWVPKDDTTTFLLTAFKVSDEKDAKLQEAFEKDWKEASGVNFILKNAPKELGILHCGLYKKFTEKPAMLYVLRAELTGAGEDSEPAKAFLAQLKKFKYPDYFEKVVTDLYKPDPENVHFSTDGKRDLPVGFTWKP